MRERLDRAFADVSWCLKYPLCKLSVTHTVMSDHDPICLELCNTSFSRKHFRFRLENIWLKEPNFHAEVSKYWCNLSTSHILPKLLAISDYMGKWGHKFFHKFRDKVRVQKKIIEGLMNRNDATGITEYFVEKENLHELLLQEETYWKQRAKTFWLAEGDANSKFFHAQATLRKRLNHISHLINDSGDVIDNQDGMQELVKEYFKGVFASPNADTNFQGMEPEGTVTREYNKRLVADLTFEEFEIATKQMHPDKASGPDGLNPAFFQHFWGMLGREVFSCCKEWLRDFSFPVEINDTNLVLIPKKEVAERMTDLRPIALCNVLYKILAKVLANRLKMILSEIISENQSAFVPRRSITDNVLLAFEMIHYMKQKKSGLVGEVALKLDISKAYDRVNWNYLQKWMICMGFDEKCIRWVMLCVTTVQYDVCFNGKTMGPIHPKRGLRQGDPLSPYLFLLCVEGLSWEITKASDSGDINDCKVCPSAPAITHLLFADDSFLFFKASNEETTRIKMLLKEYERFSGQAVNFQKSGVFYSANVRRDKQEELSGILEVHNDLGEGKYLGLPSQIGRSKKSVFNFLKDRVSHRIQGWCNKLLSMGGKTVLIKNVAQTITLYCMSCFKIPKLLCQEIERMMNQYWWSSTGTAGKGIKWLEWEKMGLAKNCGGLGFRSLHSFNLALLGMHCWNFIVNPQSLVARVFKSRYYPNEHLLHATRGGGSSYIWSGIYEAKEALCKGFRWVLGDGGTIIAHRDPWLRGKENLCVEDQDLNRFRTEKVNHYFRPNTKTWDEDRLRLDFNSSDAIAILGTRIPQNGKPDRLAWNASSDGHYSVKSAYHFWQNQNTQALRTTQSGGWKRLWQIHVPHKVKKFLWRFCKNTLPVRTLLRTKGVMVPILCPLCNRDMVHKLHVFFDCIYAEQCWQNVGLNFDMSTVEHAPTWLLRKLETETFDNLNKIATVLWGTWMAQNKKIWEDKWVPPDMAVEWSLKHIKEWRNAVSVVQGVKVNTRNPSHACNQDDIKWKHPDAGHLKLNVDASVFMDSGSFSIGMVLRDHNGLFLKGKTMRFPGNVQVFEAEAVGVHEALLEAASSVSQPLIIETDSLMVVQALQKRRQYQTEVGSTLEACQDILASKTSFRISHVRKLANKAAHLLARVPCSLNSYNYFDAPPQSVLGTIMY